MQPRWMIFMMLPYLMLAGSFPAARATRVNPIYALRHQ